MKRIPVCLLLILVLLTCAPAGDADVRDTVLPTPVNGTMEEGFVQTGSRGTVVASAELSGDDGAGGASLPEPFVPEDTVRTVFGKDDRITVKNPSEYPFSAVSNMYITASCGCGWVGTGFMIDENMLLTAAHCMRCIQHGTWADQVTFYFGYKNGKNYLYKYEGGWSAMAGTVFPNRQYDFEALCNDWCAVKLDEPVGKTTGTFGVRLADDRQIASDKYTVAGYRDNKLKYDKGWAKVYEYEPSLILYRMDDLPGNSGGPIFSPDYYAVGIICAEDEDYNYGLRLTDAVWNHIASFY